MPKINFDNIPVTLFCILCGAETDGQDMCPFCRKTFFFDTPLEKKSFSALPPAYREAINRAIEFKAKKGESL